jgi:hypothetical protein
MSSALIAKHEREVDFDEKLVRAFGARGFPDDISSTALSDSFYVALWEQVTQQYQYR